jgi:hypothetical protein
MDKSKIRPRTVSVARLLTAAGLVCAVGALGVDSAYAQGHHEGNHGRQTTRYHGHAQGYAHVYHRGAYASRYHGHWHGYHGYRGGTAYWYSDPYYAYAPPPVAYDYYGSPGVGLFFSF